MRPRVLLTLALVLLFAAGARRAAADVDRIVLAWPPTRYASAELVLLRGDRSAGALAARVVARGLDVTVVVPAFDAVRVPLPASARCVAGVDACAIVIDRVLGDAPLEAVFQSPDTAGVPDTLLLTAHDSLRVPPPSAAGTRHVVVAAACSRPRDFPETASIASIVPVQGSATVSVTGGCNAVADVQLSLPEVLTLTCSLEGDDLSGSLVVSDAPVSVLSGNTVTAVPWDVSGLSGDLILDVTPAIVPGTTSTTLLVPPLPRAAGLAGRGDVIRLVAGADLLARVRDDRGGDVSRALALGETWDVDTAAPGSDLVVRVDADGPLAAWHLAKSRALRGTGDTAGLALVPAERFTLAARFFAPDGYSEGLHVVVVAESGAALRLDGVLLPSLAAGPGGGLAFRVVPLALPPSGTGSVHELDADRPFGAWLFGQGGFKAHGMTVAEDWPSVAPPGVLVRRGERADALTELARTLDRMLVDPEPGGPWFWSVEEGTADLRVVRCGAAACLSW